jgi:hypothetical protein
MPIDFKELHFLNGVNLFDYRRYIDDNEVVECGNMFPYNRGLLSKRKGVRPGNTVNGISGIVLPAEYLDPILIDWIITSDGWMGDAALVTVLSAVPTTALEQRHIIVTIDTGDGPEAGDGAFKVIDTADPVLTRRPFMFQFEKAVYVCLNYGTFGTLKCVPGSIDFVDFVGAGNADFRPRVAAPYKQRMVWANFESQATDLVWSDVDNILQVGDSALTDYKISVPSMRGDEIVAAVEIMQSGAGTLLDSAFLILGRQSSVIIVGEPEHTESNSVQMRGTTDILIPSQQFGCASSNTLVRTEHGIVWADKDDVWAFASGQLPVRIGTKIRPALKASPPGGRHLWFAAYHDGIYRLAILGAEQHDFDIATGCREQWWLDLRDGMPRNWQEARWYGPMYFNTRVQRIQDGIHPWEGLENTTRKMCAGTFRKSDEENQTSDARLFGVTDKLQLIDYDMPPPVYDGPVAVDHAVDMEFATGDEVIGATLHTKEFDFGGLYWEKSLLRAEIGAHSRTGAPVYMSALLNGDDGQSVVIEPMTVPPEYNQVFHALGVDLAERKPARTIQLFMLASNLDGEGVTTYIFWKVNEFNDKFMIRLYSGVGGFIIVQIPHGVYYTNRQFLDALCDALNWNEHIEEEFTHSFGAPTVFIEYAASWAIWRTYDGGLVEGDGSLEDEAVKSTRLIIERLGWTAPHNTYTFATKHEASGTHEPLIEGLVSNIVPSDFEMSSVVLKVEHFGRRPTDE